MTLRPMNSRLYAFLGGTSGPWLATEIRTVAGDSIPDVTHVDVVNGAATADATGSATWALRGLTSHERYVTRAEKDELVARQPAIGRPEATQAALIPIRKSAAWWAMTQDERRAILEDRSRHIAIGLRYLPAVARRLHHCRDLGEPQPFDFLTWFEFAPADAPAFDELLAALRASEEWRFVDREIEIRLRREED